MSPKMEAFGILARLQRETQSSIARVILSRAGRYMIYGAPPNPGASTAWFDSERGPGMRDRIRNFILDRATINEGEQYPCCYFCEATARPVGDQTITHKPDCDLKAVLAAVEAM